MSTAAAFDPVAARYNPVSPEGPAVRAHRDLVWREWDPVFGPGDRILDIGCGTGVDAAHCVSRGMIVEAVDASLEMIRVAQARGGFSTRVLGADELAEFEGPYDGAFSNFWALNYVAELGGVSANLARLIRPGGVLAICTLGRYCAWEFLYYSVRGQFAKALRRTRGSAESSLGIDVSYPSVADPTHPHRLERLPVPVPEPHSRCNCQCVMCDIWKATETREISATERERHLADIGRLGVEWVVFSAGEPLMHSDLFQLARLLRQRGIRTTILSTGLLLARYSAEITSAIDDVIVSLDGPPEIYNQIRRTPGGLERPAAGVHAIHRQAPGYPITARCTVQALNVRKDELWRHFALLDSRRDACSIARRRLLPASLPLRARNNYFPEAKRTWSQRLRQSAEYASYRSRIAHHLISLPPTAASGARWWWRIRGAPPPQRAEGRGDE